MRVTYLTQKQSTSNPTLTLAHLFMTKCYSLENVFDDERKFPHTLLMNLGGKKALKSELELGYGFHILVCGSLSQVCPRHSCTLILI